MKRLLKLTVLATACAFSLGAIAEDRVDAVWKCELKDDKELEDVHAANSAWVKHINEATDVGDVTSSTVNAIVGEQGHFYFVDSYPSLAAWSTVQEYTDSDEGEAAMAEIQEKFEGIFECGSNTLYRVTPN